MSSSRFRDRRFQRRAVVGIAFGAAQRLLTTITQPRQWRLEIIRQYLSETSPEATHQRLDALKHGVDVVGEAVELVAGAGDRQSAAKVAGHDGLCGACHRIDPLEHAPADKEPAGEPEHDHQRDRPTSGVSYDGVDALTPLVEIAPDQQVEAGRRLYDAHQSAMLDVLRGLDASIRISSQPGWSSTPGSSASILPASVSPVGVVTR